MISHMQWTADRALEHWQREGLLSGKQVQELSKSLSKGEEHLPSRALSIFGTVGALLIGLGVILFFASNWQDMTQSTKLGILIVGILATAFLGYWLAIESGKYPKAGMAVLFLNSLLFGSSIFLVAQIYHLPLNYWWGTFLWFTVTAYLSIILQSRAHMLLAVPLLVFTIGWLRTTYLTGYANELDFLFDDRGSLFGLFPLLGATFIGISVLQERWKHTQFASSIVFAWGLVLVLFPIVISTVDVALLYDFFAFPKDIIALGILIVAVVVGLLAVLRGSFQHDKSKQGFIALGFYIAYLYILAKIPSWMGITNTDYYRWGYMDNAGFEAEFWKQWTVSALFVVHIILTFVLHLTVIWFGTLLRRPVVVNTGMLGLVLLIMIQYFSFAFTMMDRSLFFVLGGAILLGMSFVLERKRRQLLASFS
jgi:uncharacterized membrane protein